MRMIICTLAILLSNLIFAQKKLNNCFDVNRISEIHTEPSRKGKIPYLNKKGIVFKTDKLNKKTVLKKRIKHNYKGNPNQLNLQLAYLDRFKVAYIANYEDSVIVIPTLVGGVAVIQEVLDSQGIWRPIEVKNAVIGCGTGVFGQIELHKQEFIEIYFRKYCGNFFTKFRLKLATKDKILISEEFEGFINPKQYDLATLAKIRYKDYYFMGSSLKEELLKE